MARHIAADGEPDGPDEGMETAAILSRDLPALSASLVLHVVLLLALALVGVADTMRETLRRKHRIVHTTIEWRPAGLPGSCCPVLPPM